MSDIIYFEKNGSTNSSGTDVNISTKGANLATVKYTTSANLPNNEDRSVLIYTTDTREFFIGQGIGTAIAKIDMNNVYFADTKDGFPSEGSKEKLYITKDNHVIYIYTDNGYVAISNGEAVDPEQINSIIRSLSVKADKTELDAYRKVADKVGVADLSDEVNTKLNSISTAYDDTALKVDIALLKENKADKTDLSKYRKTEDKITIADVNDEIAKKLQEEVTPYDDTALKAEDARLEENKANKSDLDAYRKSADLIKAADLDSTLADEIKKIDKVDTLENYNDTAIKADIARIDEAKADKSDVAKIKTVSDKAAVDVVTAQTTADEAKAAVAAITPYDDTAIKTDVANIKTKQTNDEKEIADLKTAIAAKRDKDTKIFKEDIDPNLVAQFTAGTGTAVTYDDTALRAEDTRLDSVKAEKTDLTALSDKVTAMDANVTTATTTANEAKKAVDAITPYDDTAVKKDISDLQTAQSAKADKTELANYRVKTDKLALSDMDEELTNKINSIPTAYDDTALKTEDAHLEEVKADKTDVEALKTEMAAIKTTVDKAATDVTVAQKTADDAAAAVAAIKPYDDTAIKASIATAEQDATDAKTAAATAQNTATAAQTVADAAKAKADENATNIAANTTVANAAKNAAAAAQTTADDAKTKAETNATNIATVTATADKAASDLSTYKTSNDAEIQKLKDAIAALKAGTTVTVYNITAVPTNVSLSATVGTEVTALGLPTSVEATLSDGSKKSIPVTWNTTAYVKDTAGDYVVTGTMTLPEGVTNTNNLVPSYKVTLVAAGAVEYAWSHKIALPSGTAEYKNFAKTIGETMTLDDVEGPDEDKGYNKKTIEFRILTGSDQKWTGTNMIVDDAIDESKYANKIYEKYTDGIRLPSQSSPTEEMTAFNEKTKPFGLLLGNGDSKMNVTYDDENDVATFGAMEAATIVYLVRKVKTGYLPKEA